MAIKRRYHKTQNGDKVASWAYDFYDIFKRRHQKSGFKTKPEAQKAEAKAIMESNAGSKFDQNIKLKDVVEKFMELHVDIYIKESTARSYKDHYRLHIKDFFKDIKLIDVNTIIINKFVKQKQDEGLSAKSINNILTSLGTIFNWAIEQGYTMFNPAQRVKKLKVIKEEMDFLTKDEIKAVLDVSKANYAGFYPLLLTAIYTGMRRGELLGLTWDCVNFLKSTIKVKQALFKGNLSTPKTKTSIREIDTPKIVMDVLHDLRTNSEQNEMNLVFASKNGKFLDADNMIKRRFHKVLDEAGVSRIRFHDLRHTYASLLLAKNLNIKYIQKQMGHANFQIIMDTYAHIMPDVYEQSKRVIEELI